MAYIKRFSKAWFIEQLKLNSVAFVSLLTAISGFGYNTWVAHQNEINQNMRLASFEVLKNLGELQTVVNYAHYDMDKSRGNPIDGWKYVIMVKDLSRLLTPKAANEGQSLYNEWQDNWDTLGDDKRSEIAISNHISSTRQVIIELIDSLE